MAGLNELGDHLADFGSFELASDLPLEGRRGGWLASQVPSTDIVDQPIDPSTAFIGRDNALGAGVHLFSRNLGNARSPLYVLDRDRRGLMPVPGRSNGGKPDGGFDRAREERIKRRLLVDPG